MKTETKQDVEWVVAEDHPQLFECDYLNEPHEDRQTLITNPIYLQRNAEANRFAAYRVPCLTAPQCTPSRFAMTRQEIRRTGDMIWKEMKERYNL